MAEIQKIEKMMQRLDDYTRRASIGLSTTQGVASHFSAVDTPWQYGEAL